MFFRGGFLCFCFNFYCNKCFILIAKLCACGSSRFSPPNLLSRKMVFLAIGSCFLFQIYLKMLSCICIVVSQLAQ